MCTISTYFHVDVEEGTKVAEDVEAMDLAYKRAAQAGWYMEAKEEADLTGFFDLSSCQSTLAHCHPQHLVLMWSYLQMQ